MNMTFVDAMQTRDARTENGALTNSTSLNKCLDLFSLVGNHADFSNEFWAAFGENPRLAMKILFWSRDARGGAGARATFASVIKTLQKERPDVFSKIFKYIPEFGYWKDIYKNLFPTDEVLQFVKETLKNEEDHSLCAKYFPRKGLWFAKMRDYLACTPKEMRQIIVAKTQVVENYMCENDWDIIDYAGVPSVAGLRYKGAFRKHDAERYDKYIQNVLGGKEKINSSVLYPHNIYEDYLRNRYNANKANNDALQAMWDNLPNFMDGCTERMLPLCDVSGSMSGTPMAISVALGCYISQRNEGVFKDAFMTFESDPHFLKLSGTIIDRFKQLEKAPWGRSTNIQKAFDTILTQAICNNVPESEMPTKLLIISDMHFNVATASGRGVFNWITGEYEGDNSKTNFEVIKSKYEAAGYKMPGIVFWNVDGDAGNVPATMNDVDVALVSGYSPSILTNILKAKVLTPIQLMLDTVMAERYACIEI